MVCCLQFIVILVELSSLCEEAVFSAVSRLLELLRIASVVPVVRDREVKTQLVIVPGEFFDLQSSFPDILLLHALVHGLAHSHYQSQFRQVREPLLQSF